MHRPLYPNDVPPIQRAFVAVSALLVALGVPSCRSNPARAPNAPVTATEELNQQLSELASLHATRFATEDYRVGPGDVLAISVFQAEELNRTLRIRPDGTISLPLLGSLQVAGQTTTALEQTLAARYGSDYLKDPHVSVFLEEYRAHPVSVLGEVRQPGLYYLREPRTLVEMLSEAGGLTEAAGSVIHLRRRTRDADGEIRLDFLAIDLESLLADSEPGFDASIHDNDTLFVPKAGMVFVEGAVERPGAYPLHGAATVLKAITLAGGPTLEAKKSGIRVIRASGDPDEIVRVDLGDIREDPESDVPVADGDVVVVGSSAIKVTLIGFWRGIAGLVNLSKGF